MNFLAHTFLSFSDEQLVGNMIGDFVQNKKRILLPEGIQKGITLHRAIDTFTDAHPVFVEAKKVFQPIVRLYAGAFVDVVFDYFLANDEKIKSEEEWRVFTENTYRVLHDHMEFLPENFQLLLPKMKEDDWLFNYRYDWGMEYSIRNVLNKAKYLDREMPVFEVFKEHKSFLQNCYDEFFPDLHAYSKELSNSL